MIFFAFFSLKRLEFYAVSGKLVVESSKKWGKVGNSPMFMGEYRHSLDAKNRMIVPAKFREELGETFVVTKGLDGCLSVYTEAQWTEIAAQLAKLPATKREARQYIRHVMSKAQECTFDSQGRIQLPQVLIAEADIVKKCVVIGAADHVEIWAEEKWDAYDADADASFETVAESLTEFLQ